MPKFHLSSLIPALTLILCISCRSPSSSYDRIQIHEEPKVYGLYVPASKLILVIPKNDLKPKPMNIGGSTTNPRYFYFENNDSSLILSGWFESSTRFSSVKEIWEQDCANWAKDPSLSPQDVKFETIENWQCVSYSTTANNKIRRHIRAHFVKEGTWIDLHLSEDPSRPISTNTLSAREILQVGVVTSPDSQ